MKLERTKQLIHGKINKKDPMGSLVHVLESAIELISLPDNDFFWSSWDGPEEAVVEITDLISLIKRGCLPERVRVSVLFSPTGSFQEVSLSSGWADPFLKVAEKYDQVEKLLWKKG